MKILVTIPALPHQKAKLEAAMPGAEFLYQAPAGVTPELLGEIDICIGNIPVPMVKHAAKLKWIQLNSAGTNGYTENVPENVLLTNATGAYGLAISEWMLGMTLMLVKKMDQYLMNCRRGLWRDEGTVGTFCDSTTLVVGLGDLGGEYAKKMSMLGSHVIGVRAHRTPCPDYLERLETMEELDELLPQADIVALCLPDTPATRGLMDARRFGLMKRGSILINVGRGNVLDQMALVDALQNGNLGAAALDVTDPEPLPADHPLWQQEDVFITPHVSGGYHAPQTLERIVDIAARNLESYAAGRPLENMVDRKAGYRAFQG